MEWLEQRLKKLQQEKLERITLDLEEYEGNTAKYKDKRYTIFASNDYMGLKSHPVLKEVYREAILKYGVGSGGSRLTTGSRDVFTELESKIAYWKKQEAALLYATGYMANVGVISSIAQSDWTIFSDELNHASIIDGCKLARAQVVIYKHVDIDDLELKLKACKSPYKLVVSDGVFSMDGDIIPLKAWLEVCKKYGAVTMLDDAHASGVLGETGMGTPEYYGIEKGIDLHIGTCSKALGCEGGFVAASQALIRLLKSTSRPFVFSTAMSPAMAVTINAAIDYIMTMHKERKYLSDISGWVKDELRKMGYNVLMGETPIVPIITGEIQETLQLADFLMNNGVIVSGIRPPTVKKGESRIRLALSTAHTKEEIAFMLEVFKKWNHQKREITRA